MQHRDTRPPERVGRDEALVSVLQEVWTYERTTRGDLARVNADDIAEAASRGFVTTAIIPHGQVYGRLWKVTPEGLAFLYANANALNQEEVRYVEAHCAR